MVLLYENDQVGGANAGCSPWESIIFLAIAPDHNVKQIKLKNSNDGYTGTANISIRATTGSPPEPTGSDLGSFGTITVGPNLNEWYTSSILTSPVTLTAGQVYAIILEKTSVNFAMECTYPTAPYKRFNSGDGITWGYATDWNWEYQIYGDDTGNFVSGDIDTQLLFKEEDINFLEDFENWNVNNWVDDTWGDNAYQVDETSIVFAGLHSRHLHINNQFESTGESTLYLRFQTFKNYGPITTEFEMYIPSSFVFTIPTDGPFDNNWDGLIDFLHIQNETFFIYQSDADSKIYMALYEDYIDTGSGTANIYNPVSTEITTDAWHKIKVVLDIYTNGSLQIYLDNILVYTITGSLPNVSVYLDWNINFKMDLYANNDLDYGDKDFYFDNFNIIADLNGPALPYSIDTELFQKSALTIDSNIDTLIQQLDLTTSDNIDTLITKINLIPNDIDIILKRLDITKTDTIDILLQALGITTTNSIDVLVQMLALSNSKYIDFIIKGAAINKSIDVDLAGFGITNSKTIDTIIDNFLLKGRMNAAKESLISKIQAYDSTLVVMDAWRLNKWDFDAQTENLVSIKIMPSRMNRLNYGSMITESYFGQYYSYHFTLHVLAKYDNTKVIHAKTAMDTANGIVNYLRINQQDTNKGVLSILDITARESDPYGMTRGGAFMARIIVEGVMFCERPYKYKSEVV